MRIAQLTAPWISVPPAGYGGTEWVVEQLCNGLSARGHEVVLYATGDSHTKAELRSLFPVALTEDMGSTSYDARQVSWAFADIEKQHFDLVHDHSGFVAVAFSSCLRTPLVHTVHRAFDHDAFPFYEQFAHAAHYVCISKYQQSMGPPGMAWAGLAYNAVAAEKWPFRAQKDDYFLAFSRIAEDKGFHLAIDAAMRTGSKLVIAGVVQDANRHYFETQIAPRIDGEQITYVAEVSDERKHQLFARARAFLFPITWDEPFGLVMIEAMAAGTPVLALRRGSVPEIVEDGRTGFVCDTLDELVGAMRRVDQIDPYECRKAVEERFTIDRMIDDYEAIYERILRH